MAEQQANNRSVLHFDAGPADSPVEPGSELLSAKNLYTPKKGFGWTDAPPEEFTRGLLEKSRDSKTIDGVAGPRLGFRADLVPGDWWVTIWLESGLEDPNSLDLQIQGQSQSLRWQKFVARAEPQRDQPKTYRVFQGLAKVGSEGLSIQLGGDEKVRLLGLSLIRRAAPTTAAHRQLFKRLSLAGAFESKDSLSELTKQIKDALNRNPDDACSAFWLQQLEQLTLAEDYFAMRGWEWAKTKTGLGMFDRFYQAVMLLDGLLSADPDIQAPLSERALFVRGRILYWLNKQAGGDELAFSGRRDLQQLYALHPDNALLAMYVEQQIDLPDPCDCLASAANAPTWSVAQREALCRLREISHWWVEQQQAPNGEFGGKLGDDVELLRWWTPLVLSGDTTAQRGWEQLADCVWRSDHIRHGYARKVSDVEHASEFVADTMCVLTLFNDDPQYLDRLSHSAKHFDQVWTGLTTGGHRHFRSAWFSATQVDTNEPKGRDLEYNSRAVKAMRYLVHRKPDPTTIRLLHEWSLAWVHAALRTDKGKPRGIVPASIRFTDEALNGDEQTWYQANMFWNYYEWKHYAGSMMLDQLLFTYLLTKDKQLLEPMFLALELIQAEESQFPNDGERQLKKGSPTWAAFTLAEQQPFWNVVEQWRFSTGDPRWDDLILRYGTHYGGYRLSGDERHLVTGLERLLENVRYNTPLKTSEAVHTDRVYAPGSDHLKAMLTGDGVQEDLSPYFAVTWEQTGTDFTALVTETGRDTLQVKLYSHSDQSEQITMRPWQLTPGTYRLRIDPQELESSDKLITIEERGQQVTFELPSRRLVDVSVERDR